MKNPIIIIIFNGLSRVFGRSLNKLEDQLANSEPVRQIARTIVGFMQRGSWELKQLKDNPIDQVKRITQDPALREQWLRKKKELEQEFKKRMEGKF